MNKKILAVAVASMFAAPAAFAQSSVTISGYMKVGLDSFKITSPVAARAGMNTSENRITDHSSRILFNVVEDLGGGLQAIAQYDLRVSGDAVNRTSNTLASGQTQTSTPSINTLNAGNNHVGLRSAQWGSIRFGRQDTHYGNAGDTIATKAGHLGAFNSSVFDSVQRPGGTSGVGASSNQTIANQSRTPNLVWYDSPKWGGFGFMVGYSSNPIRTSTTPEYENDLSSGNRKGRMWTFNPVYNGGNWEVAWSHWNAKSDWSGCPATQVGFATSQGCLNPQDDQKADSVRGHYIFPMGLRLGLAWNHSKTIGSPWLASGAVNTFSGRATGDRKAWAIPVSYNTGAHTFYLTHTKAGDSKATGVTGANTGAKLTSLAYNYDLSKRTSAALTYVRLKNESNASYNTFFTGDSALGGTNSTANVGEGQRLMGFTLRHNF